MEQDLKASVDSWREKAEEYQVQTLILRSTIILNYYTIIRILFYYDLNYNTYTTSTGLNSYTLIHITIIL